MSLGTVLVAGSTAIDMTGLYPGDFQKYQSTYPINALNMSFQLAGMESSFGGCAPNIAWGLAQLSVKSIPLSSAGRNFRDQYESHLNRHNIDTRYIAVDDTTENLDISDVLKKKNVFALTVNGDSMIDAYIADGDMVLMEPVKEPLSIKNGTARDHGFLWRIKGNLLPSLYETDDHTGSNQRIERGNGRADK